MYLHFNVDQLGVLLLLNENQNTIDCISHIQRRYYQGYYSKSIDRPNRAKPTRNVSWSIVTPLLKKPVLTKKIYVTTDPSQIYHFYPS